MERSWWWKSIGILLLIVVGVVYLLPTVMGEDRLPSWYTKYVKAKLQLGLDLQGGIHLVYQVDVDKAVENEANRLAANLEQYLIDKINQGKKTDKQTDVAKVGREGRDDLLVTFKSASDLKLLDAKTISDYYSLNEAECTDIREEDEEAGEAYTQKVETLCKEGKTRRLRIDGERIKEVQDYALRQGIETIRGRVDKFGVAEPSIRAKGKDIVVELPGLTKKHFERVKKVIGRTAQLEFKLIDDDKEGREFMTKVAAKVTDADGIEIRHDSYDGRQRGNVTFTFLQSKDKKVLEKFIKSLAGKGLPVPRDHEIAFGEEQAKDEKGRPLPDRHWRSYYLFRRAELTGEFLTDAEVQWDERTSRPEVGMTLDRKGAEIFERLSGDHVGWRMAIILDGKVNSDPVFQSRIGGGRARITLGGFKDPFELQREAKDLAAVLKTGALPAPLTKVFETQVGPTLGRDAVKKGVLAFGIGGGLVILFILYYYRGAGLICDLGLVINFLFIAAILSGFQATLTLPGIAGLVLTIGMAVDANVIIYERIREELAAGKSPRAAVDAGYSRAFWTIFDAQLTTAIAAFVLMQYGSGPIRGFAVTLLVGIISSIFTGVVVTRLMFDFVVGKFRPKSLSI